MFVCVCVGFLLIFILFFFILLFVFCFPRTRKLVLKVKKEFTTTVLLEAIPR